MVKYKWKHLPQYIKTAREIKNFTQNDLAFYLGIQVQSISNFERGTCNLPPKHFKNVATVLSVDLEEMIKKYLADESDRLHHYL